MKFSLNILYITFRPEDQRFFIGFATALDAENFLQSQSCNKEWHAQWKLERVFSYGEFHYSLSIDKYVSLTFNNE